MTPAQATSRVKPADLPAVLRAGGRELAARVVGVAPHTLMVAFPGGERLEEGFVFDEMRIGEQATLGACSFVPHPAHPLRRHDDPPPPPGDGLLVFTDSVYDFSGLLRGGPVGDVQEKLQQLPLIWQRKDGIHGAFREYTADLVYDIQAYRLLLDEIDRNLAAEPLPVRVRVRQRAIGVIYPDFLKFFDARLERLKEVVAGFSRQEHERHGFYFRKHVWDLILASPFLARTNLKPRGYAGDSMMMQMLYENEFRGAGLFSMCMHRHPVQTAAAQAVRNRRALIAEAVQARAQAVGNGRRVRVLSVACGPAAELTDVLKRPADADRFEFMLLDQDAEALAEATAAAQAAAARLKRDVLARPVRESVRTMLRTPDVVAAWGVFDLVYTMGLFDYLQQPVARVVIRKLYELLQPGGELIVGNFHVGNPSRLYMDYWMDWALVYRTEDEMYDLVAGLDGAAATIDFEDTRSQMFLRVRKAAA